MERMHDIGLHWPSSCVQRPREISVKLPRVRVQRVVAVVRFDEVDAPSRQRARVVVEVTVAAWSAVLARERAHARVQTDFQSLGVYVICQLLHAVGKAMGVGLHGKSRARCGEAQAGWRAPEAARCRRV